MKKLLLVIAMVAAGFTANAQEANGQTAKGKWVIEANTGSATTGNTSFSLATSNGNTEWSIGLDGGYFVADDLAVKAGLGYRDNGFADAFAYKIGAEYYIGSQFPVSVDFTGDTNSDLKWLGLQAGYAWFLGENVSLKPAVRYNVGLDDQDGVFQGLVGFAFYF
ncbi:hypothetical protein CSC81_03130 [Tenacibaculum discolor]|uniref:Outer membrane protein beta-barrel domain-containing protein n=1 Tax=Tenacibaculum discolor TaxID=361581 RepID=A0A2G1BX91_9FLAO|nr:hypothetical protein [Tenacibaculum discolor]MDP2540537.1 hypothetical protein [Tenacibaculum discolor]PHN98499.1 hypothetical protein CSC81_03130 [Tenacibaculum discolor]PHO00008.1 hypothetical protein CSC82_31035 [Rhodobacteraceae bacterium 4F10]